mmetsp:Transcript_74079/g.187901  ORF Transcript_74079/g.187901 Transcript_74079/m.187901 type:complete len:919 (+) Transcript_74079:1-2757(+)
MQDHLKTCLAEVAQERAGQNKNHQMLNEKFGQLQKSFQEHLEALEAQVKNQQEAFKHHHDIVREHLSAEKKGRETHEGAVKESLAQEMIGRDGYQASLQEHLKNEKETHKQLHASVQDRVSALEQAVGGADERTHADWSTVSSSAPALGQSGKYGSLTSRLTGLEKLLGHSSSQSAEVLKDALGKLSQEQHGRDTFQKLTQARLDKFELFEQHSSAQVQGFESLLHSHLGQLSDKLDKNLSNVQAKLREDFQTQLCNERQARESFHTTIQEHVATERTARSAHHSEVNNRVLTVEQKHTDEVASLREQVSAESHARVKHYEAVQEHLASERRARDAHEKAARAHFSEDRETREAHEQLLRERLNHERESRESHQEQVRGHLMQEKAAREAQQQRHQDHSKGETAAREQSSRKLQDGVSEERSFREHHAEIIQDLVEREKAARKRLEERVAKERKEFEDRQRTLEAHFQEMRHQMDHVLSSASALQSDPKSPTHAARSADSSPGNFRRSGRGTERSTVVTVTRAASRSGSPKSRVEVPGRSRHSAGSIDQDVHVQQLHRAWPPMTSSAAPPAQPHNGGLEASHPSSTHLALSNFPPAMQPAAGAARCASNAPGAVTGSYGIGLHMSVAGTGATGSYVAAPPVPGYADDVMAPLMVSSTGHSVSPMLESRSLSPMRTAHGSDFTGTSALQARQQQQQQQQQQLFQQQQQKPREHVLQPPVGLAAHMDVSFLRSSTAPSQEPIGSIGLQSWGVEGTTSDFWKPVGSAAALPALPILPRTRHFASAGTSGVAPPTAVPAHVPRVLCVESPNGHMSCIGEYALVLGELRNGFPVWKQKAGDRFVYSGTNGKWYLAGLDARDQDFSCQLGVIHSSHAHLGMTPDSGAMRWVRKYGSDYYDDPAIKISVVPDAHWDPSSRLLRLE